MATRRITLRLNRERLLYDIQNYAYIEAQTVGADTPERKALTFDICQDDNVARVNRTLSIAHGEIMELLLPYSRSELPDEVVIDNSCRTPSEYVCALNVPSTISGTSIHLLAKLAHEYMVCRALADWFLMSKPEASQQWELRGVAATEAMSEAKNFRGVMTRPLSVF